MRILLCGWMLAAFALVAAADTEVTGKWSGSYIITAPNGETKDSTAYLVLKQTGADITGTAGPNEDEQLPITKGKIEGDKITLELEHEAEIIKLALVRAGDRITGDATMSHEGQTVTAKLDVTRLK
jgi:hypothetical protein